MSSAHRSSQKGRVDWAALKGRVDTLVHASETEASERVVLRERARRLAAARPAATAINDREHDWLIFFIGNERFALDAGYLFEVVRRPTLSRVPLAPPELRALANHRGSILPVFELLRLLGRRGSELDPDPWLLVLGQAEPELGLLASGVADLAPILGRVAAGTAHPGGIICGVTPDGITLVAADLLLRDGKTFIGGAEATRAAEE